MEAYRAPYRNRKRRLPTLVWPRELPIEGEPTDVVALAEANAKWLIASTNLPKLSLTVTPASITGRVREFCRRWPNQREVTVKGLHHLQADSPREIRELCDSLSLSNWSSRLGRFWLTVGASSFPRPAKALQSVELAHGVLFAAPQESYCSTHENTPSVA